MDVNELAEWFRSITREELLAMSSDTRFAGNEKKFLYDCAVRLSKGNTTTTKQMHWLYSLFEKRDGWETGSAYQSEHEYVSRPAATPDHRHLCARLAWHDAAWDGNVCLHPGDNIYCGGEQSLLSDRLRRRRDLTVEDTAACRGKSANAPALGAYQPPCFWSINAFGPRTLEISHDNPAESSYPHIKEQLPPYSIISWPFDLSFVRDAAEKKKLGSYYPKPIFERRIKDFHARIVERQSIVFLYCKFSNPVSEEDSDYLLVGCGLASGKGALNRFDVSQAELQATKDKKREPNFPTLNWALRYSLDYENTGVRIPYQEYLALINNPGGLPQQYLDDIKVVVRESELIDGFRYVAKHVDDDQAIFLLMKLRLSLLEVKRHAVLPDFDVEPQLDHVDSLLSHAWHSRGYLPGLKPSLIALLGRSVVDTRDIDAFLAHIDLASPPDLGSLTGILDATLPAHEHEPLIGDVLDGLERYSLTSPQFLRLASLNLTTLQFSRILNREALNHSPAEVAENPYLLFEAYVPQEEDKDRTSGEKLDGEIDLFKADIAIFPQRRYLRRDPTFHNWKLDDPRRVRAVLMSLLRQLETKGHCYDTAQNLAAEMRRYPLFYQIGDEYQFAVDLEAPEQQYRSHFEKQVVLGSRDRRTIYYLKDVFDDERYIENVVERLLSAPDNAIKVDSRLVQQAEAAANDLKAKLGERFHGDDFVAERKRLYSILPQRRFSVLTGSPGAGKSYELLKLVTSLSTSTERYLVLSLTGKAVLRLRNNELGIKNIHAKTIDKFLTEIARQEGVKTIVHNLIIEEASMVDLTKLARVLRAVDPLASHFRRLILVGDENQLPPIGYGKPFSDLVESLRADGTLVDRHYVTLSTNCRAELPEEFIDLTNVFANQSKMGESTLSKILTDKKAPGVLLQTWRNKEDLYQRLQEDFAALAQEPKTLDTGLDLLLGRKPLTGKGEAGAWISCMLGVWRRTEVWQRHRRSKSGGHEENGSRRFGAFVRAG